MGSSTAGSLRRKLRRGALGAALASGLVLAGCGGFHLFERHSKAPPPASTPRSSPIRSEEYVVKKGDTLGRIAGHYGVDVDQLMRANGIDDPKRLAVGRVLVIPTSGQSPLRAARKSPAHASAKASRQPPGAPPPPQASAPSASRPRPEADEALAQAQAAFDDADFEGSLAAADRARTLLSQNGRDLGDRNRMARAYLLRGMAEVGLDRDDEARKSFRKALELDRGIKLDPDQVSPKIVEAFRQAGE